jgi:hypothetical protein
MSTKYWRVRHKGSLTGDSEWSDPTSFEGTSAPVDPDFGSVSLLLKFDGGDGSSAFVDSSSLNKTIGISGTPSQSSAQVKWGASSLYSVDDSFPSASGTELDFNHTNLTVECWIHPTFISGTEKAIASKIEGSTGWVLELDLIGRLSLTIYTGSLIQQIGTTFISLDQWTHVAVSKEGSTWRLFVNGNLDRTFTAGNALANTSDLRISSRSDGINSYFIGYIDDFRFTTGVCRYTADFTPPDGPFPDLGPP